jgi:hypothetical protein
MNRSIGVCLFVFFTAAWAAAQCPSVRTSGPSDTVTEATPVTFAADVSGGDLNVTPTFNWTVSAGTIASGQGSSAITVDTTGAGGMSITATVDVGGYDRSCSTTSSWTSEIGKVAAGRKFDEFGPMKLGDRSARLDNFAIELQSDPTAQGYLVAYGGRRSSPITAKTTLNLFSAYLTKTRGINATRIVTIDGGYRDEPITELWIVPSGAMPPGATPTVDPSEVSSPKVKKPRAKAVKRRT